MELCRSVAALEADIKMYIGTFSFHSTHLSSFLTCRLALQVVLGMTWAYANLDCKAGTFKTGKKVYFS